MSPKLLEIATASSKLVAKNRFHFTKKKLDSLPLPRVQAYHYDMEVRGLALAISPLGRKTFVLYRKVNGRPERIKIGLYPDLSIEQARARASEMNGAIGRGENPADKRRAIRDEDTIAELFSRYIADRREHGKKTCDDLEWLYKRYLGTFALQKISAVSKQDCTKLHASIGRNHGKYAANRALELLSSMYNFAVDECDWKGSNPASGIKSYREKKRERFLQPVEFPAFFQALKEEPNENIRDFIMVSLLTGARRGNVQAMRWDEIEFAQNVWRIPETKNGESQTVVLSPPALNILQARKENATGKWVFPGTGQSGHLEEPKAAWKRILNRAGIKDLRIHDLRRTLGSWQAATGSSLPIIGKSLGHKSLAATQVYARLDLDPVRASVNRATEAMMLAAGAPKQLEGNEQ